MNRPNFERFYLVSLNIQSKRIVVIIFNPMFEWLNILIVMLECNSVEKLSPELAFFIPQIIIVNAI
jgi:hypothetical protein